MGRLMKTIALRISPELYEQVQVAAARCRLSPSDYLRRVLEAAVLEEPGLRPQAPGLGAEADRRLAHGVLFTEMAVEYLLQADDKLSQELHATAAARLSDLLGRDGKAEAEGGNEVTEATLS